MVHVFPQRPAAHQHGLLLRVHANIVHRRKIDYQSVVAPSQAACVVPAAAYGHQQLLLAPEIYSRDHVRHVGAPRNQSRPPLYHPVVDLARRLVAGIAPLDQPSAQAAPESSNRRFVQHGRLHSREFDARHHPWATSGGTAHPRLALPPSPSSPHPLNWLQGDPLFMKTLAILGSTGSIGRQTLSVVESLPDQFKIVALAAGHNLDELLPQIERHHPELVSVATPQLADELARRLREKNLSPLPVIHHGREGMLAVGTHPGAEIVVSAAVGVVGLEATYEAVKLGRTVALSNKEVLVAAGELVMAAAQKAGRELLPVDSEHNAVHQCLRGGTHAEVRP